MSVHRARRNAPKRSEKARELLESPQNQWILGEQDLNEQRQLPNSPSLVTESGTTARPRGLVLQAPLHLVGALCLFIQENSDWQSSCAQLGSILGTAET